MFSFFNKLVSYYQIFMLDIFFFLCFIFNYMSIHNIFSMACGSVLGDGPCNWICVRCFW